MVVGGGEAEDDAEAAVRDEIDGLQQLLTVEAGEVLVGACHRLRSDLLPAALDKLPHGFHGLAIAGAIPAHLDHRHVEVVHEAFRDPHALVRCQDDSLDLTAFAQRDVVDHDPRGKLICSRISGENTAGATPVSLLIASFPRKFFLLPPFNV